MALAVKDLIRYTRKSQGLTQQQLADKAGVSKNTITAIENDLRQASIPMLETIAKAFGCTLNIQFISEESIKDNIPWDTLLDG